MQKSIFSLVIILLLASSCYQPERECKNFKNGTFSYTATIDDKEITTTFVRNNAIEIDYFNNKSDTSSVRWINDCEYIVKKLKPKNRTEEKSIHMKILSTTAESYTFEYSVVGDSKKSIGTAFKTK